MEDFIEYIPLEDIFEAYYDCRRKKKKTINAVKFESDYEVELVKLWREINTQTYQIGKSIVFIVTRPVRREVFAADFRDRIVQHLVVRRLEPFFEEYFIQDNYNCRKNKGVLYGVQRLYEHVRKCSHNYKEPCYIAKCDIQAFFMSIHKPTLWKMLQAFIIENYKGDDLHIILWLTEMIVMHNPERDCIIKSPKWMWKGLPKHKSLFTSSKYYGLAIGNITSQMFANFYMTTFDKWMHEKYGGNYGRYVDDFNFVGQDVKAMWHDIPEIRVFLKENLGLNLHPKKLYVQHYRKGCKFIGTVVKGELMYVSNRTVSNFIDTVRKFNILAERSPDYVKENAEHFVSSLNSYFGLLGHYQSYAIRRKVANMISSKWFEVMFISGHFDKVVCKIPYTTHYSMKRKSYEKTAFRPDEYDTNKYSLINYK